jgi:hypothetical protein
MVAEENAVEAEADPHNDNPILQANALRTAAAREILRHLPVDLEMTMKRQLRFYGATATGDIFDTLGDGVASQSAWDWARDWRSIRTAPPRVIALLTFSLALQFAVYAAALGGFFVLIRCGEWEWCWLLALALVYFVTVTGPNTTPSPGGVRYRIVLLPVLSVMAAIGFRTLVAWWTRSPDDDQPYPILRW